MAANYSIPVSILLDNMDHAIKFTANHLLNESIKFTIDKKTLKGYPIFLINKRKYVLRVFYYGDSLVEHPLPFNFKATPPFKKVRIRLNSL